MVKMVKIDNSKDCFVMLWRLLERTRRLLGGQCKRYCIRHVLKAWFGYEANDEFIWKVCHLCEQEGWNELPLPSLCPRKHRELLRAIVAVKTGISYYKINLRALDAAYSIAFPKSTPININKKKKNHVTKRN
jgi:hypothetical protein